MKSKEGLLHISTVVHLLEIGGSYTLCSTDLCRQVVLERQLKTYWDTLQNAGLTLVLYVPFWTPEDIRKYQETTNEYI